MNENTTTGVEQIRVERLRQMMPIDQGGEGFTPEQDSLYQNGELPRAAMCFAHAAALLEMGYPLPGVKLIARRSWPWNDEWWKPSADKVANLKRAGALIAAEIDRLQAEEAKPKLAQEAQPGETSKA